MGRIFLPLALCAALLAPPQQTATAPSPPPSQDIASAPPHSQDIAPAPRPLPPIRDLILQVETNQKAAEAAQKDYTYHVRFEEQELDKQGNVKKVAITDSESLTIDGVRVDRVVARNGKPLTADETNKESERIDKRVAKAKEDRDKRESKGKDTDANGDDVLSASRILELGAFSQPRRVDLNGRPTIVLDYAGDPHASTRNRFESIVRDLVGTVWIDEQDRVLVQAQGHFLKDFKVGGGLIADIKGGSSFEFHNTKINDEVWLPGSVSAQGRIRVLLVAGFNGRIHMVTSDYKKFRTTTTILQSDRVIGPDGQPISPDHNAQPSVPPIPPQS